MGGEKQSRLLYIGLIEERGECEGPVGSKRRYKEEDGPEEQENGHRAI